MIKGAKGIMVAGRMTRGFWNLLLCLCILASTLSNKVASWETMGLVLQLIRIDWSHEGWIGKLYKLNRRKRACGDESWRKWMHGKKGRHVLYGHYCGVICCGCKWKDCGVCDMAVWSGAIFLSPIKPQALELYWSNNLVVTNHLQCLLLLCLLSICVVLNIPWDTLFPGWMPDSIWSPGMYKPILSANR